jgi:hypothetical protein
VGFKCVKVLLVSPVLITCIYLRYTCALPGHFSSIILMKLIKAEVQVWIFFIWLCFCWRTVSWPPLTTSSPFNCESYTKSLPDFINHGSNYQQNVNPGMFYSWDRSSDNFMGNLGSIGGVQVCESPASQPSMFDHWNHYSGGDYPFVKFYGLMVHPLPAGRYSLGRHHAATRHGPSHLVFLAFLMISPSLVCLL